MLLRLAWTVLIAVLLGLGPCARAQDERPLSLGIVAIRSKADVEAKWGALAVYLGNALGRKVELHAYDYRELDEAIDRNAVDVVLTNPAHFLHLRHHHSLSAPLATLVTLADGQRLMATGGVIFTRADRTDIATLADLAGKRIATAATHSLSGYEAQAFEMLQAGVPVPRDEQLLVTGMPNDKVVQAVLDGRADVGFVRASLLEAMADQGKLDLDRVRAVHIQNLPAYPFTSSTRLYPEWPVGVMSQVDEDLARRLTVALLSVQPGGVIPDQGFTVPADYSGVEMLMRELRVPPFDAIPPIRLADVWARYHVLVLLLAGGGCAVLILAAVLLKSNRRLAAARREARKNAFRYGSLLDTATDGIHIMDAGGRLLEASESFYRMLGYAKGTPLEIGDWEAQWRPEEMRERLKELMQQGRIFETRHRRRDGQMIEVEISAQGIAIDGPPQVYASARDISPRKAAERALAESESRARLQSERLQEVIRGTNAGTWEWDLRSGQMAVNARWAELIDYPLAELGPVRIETWRALSHPDDRRRADELLERCFRRELDTFECEVRLRRRDGGWSWGLDRGRVVEWSPDGQPARMSGTRLDIDARKQAEAELEQHRQNLEDLVRRRTQELSASETRANRIIEAAPDGLYGVDTAGRITFFNLAASRMLGYSAEAVLGQSAHDLFHLREGDGNACPEGECPVLQCLRTGNSTRAENDSLRHADGRLVPVMYACHSLVLDGEIAGAVVSLVDLSARRAVEEAREQALAAAEKLAQARREFLANMSHEIRTPLNGILGFAHIGHQQCRDTGRARDAFAKILDSGQLLLGIVNDILDFSKIEHGSLVLESIPVDLQEVVRNTTALITDKAAVKGLAVDIYKAPDVPARILGDPLRLKQILTNLLANAVKFTEFGSVRLTVFREGNELLFEVADTGIGMDAGQMDRLFNPFEQADGSTTRRFGGTGLGLAIARRLVELMDGRVDVKSTPGVGSIFTIRLPYQPAEPVVPWTRPQAAPSPETPFPLAGLTILVAEDNEINQLVIREILEEVGADVVLVENGQEAVERAVGEGRGAFDLVLMDIQMPVMDGYEAARRIIAADPDMPVIGQSADAFAEDREKCFAAGMVAHIAKPIDPDELIELARRHARSSGWQALQEALR